MFPLGRNLRLKLEQTLFGRNAFSGLRARARPVICECTEMCDGHSSSKDRNLCLMSSLNLKLFLIAPISPVSKWIATYPKAYVCTSENSPRVYTSGEITLAKKLKASSHIWESPIFKDALKRQPKLCGWHWESDGCSPPRGDLLSLPTATRLILDFPVRLITQKNAKWVGFHWVWQPAEALQRLCWLPRKPPLLVIQIQNIRSCWRATSQWGWMGVPPVRWWGSQSLRPGSGGFSGAVLISGWSRADH